MAWFPGATRDPGRNAGYRRGRSRMQLGVLHFTVGTDSRALIRDQGLAQFLLPKVGAPFQFAEADAVCSHACEWNTAGPGLEFERLSWGEPLTPDQVFWGGRIIAWLRDTYGIPLAFHGGARLPIGDGFRGFANHGSLVHRACDQHTDGVTADDFSRMVAGDKGAAPMAFLTTVEGGGPRGPGAVYCVQGNLISHVTNPDTIGLLQFTGEVPANIGHISASAASGLQFYPPDSTSRVVAFLRKLFPKRSEGKDA